VTAPPAFPTGEVDPDAVAAAARGCADVVDLSSGLFAETATYLPGRRIPGVRLRSDGVEVHIVARYGRPLPEVADQVRAAVTPLVGAAPVDVLVDDIAQDGDESRQAPTDAAR
jgi:hypothetical protein